MTSMIAWRPLGLRSCHAGTTHEVKAAIEYLSVCGPHAGNSGSSVVRTVQTLVCYCPENRESREQGGAQGTRPQPESAKDARL